MFLSRGDRDLGVAFQTHPRWWRLRSRPLPYRSSLASLRVRRSLARGVTLLHLRAPLIDARETVLERGFHHCFLIGRERRIEAEPGIAHLMPKRDRLGLRLILRSGDRGEIGLGLRELGIQ